MKQIITYLLAFTCPAFGAEETDTSPVFKSSDTQSIIAKDGQKITIQGIVSTVRKSNGGTNFINFEDSEFYLVAFKSDLKAFENGEPADLYRGKHLTVTGVTSIYKGKPQMKLSHPDMVKIVNPDEADPAPIKKKRLDPPSPKKPIKTPQKVDSTNKKKRAPVDPKKYFK